MGAVSEESTSTSRYRTLLRKKYKIPLIGFIYLILVHPAVPIYTIIRTKKYSALS
jgi:hypothetical protein